MDNMATTARRHSTFRFPPLPPSKNTMVADKNSQPAEDNRGDAPSDRGTLPLDHGVSTREISSLPSMNHIDKMEDAKLGGGYSLGQNSRAVPLKRRRSLPCPQSVPNNCGNNFLHGIQLEECKDILSIPDPPPPPALQSSRRASGTFAPLRDVSNGDKGLDSPTASKRERPSILPSRKPKRSRLSLPSMASPIVSKKTVASSAIKTCPMDDTERNETVGSLDETSSQVPKGGERNSDYTHTTRSNGNATFQTFKGPEKAPDVYNIPTQPDTEGLMEIRKLVHAYTLLPKEQRFQSKEAKEIETVSGYPVVPSFVPEGILTSSDKHDRRKKIIDNLSIRMRNVDACKARDAQLMQSVTQCRVHKLRGGYVEYTHIPTGRSVPAEEFEARYMCMVDEVSSVRSKSWGDYFAKLSQEMKANDCAKLTDNEEDCPSTGSSSHPDSSSPMRESSPSSTAENEEALPEESSDDTDMIDADEACDNGAEEVEALCSEVIYKTIDTTQCQAEEKPRTTPAKMLPRPPSPTSPDMLLPFPSRDQPSSNALIARAEQKLWTAIDDALATYSKEVLEIQAAAVRK